MLGFGLLGKFARRLFGGFMRGGKLRARYDAAQTTSDNREHWAYADAMSAASANSSGVRRTLRNRARYEVANNSYARGITLTLANDLVGTGPRLQIVIPGIAQSITQRIENEFAAWSRETNLAEKLWTMRLSRCVDGEAFAVLASNYRLRSRVKLALKLVECDRVTATWVSGMSAANQVLSDGIEYDEFDEPSVYHMLREHPGNAYTIDGMLSDPVPADLVIHWFRRERPGQIRGVPEITAALPLFAYMRRFKLATIAAAETAANFAGVLKMPGAPNTSDDVGAEHDVRIEMDAPRNTLVSMPEGAELTQLKAEHPATTLEMFERSNLREVGRGLNVPFGIAAGDSAGYNYASGRLDHQVYFRQLGIDRNSCEIVVLSTILRAWLDEAVLIEGLIPMGLPPIAEWKMKWHWDGFAHVDPQKEASAQQVRLSNGTTSRDREYAAVGLDMEEEDVKAAESYGITVEDYRDRLAAKHLGPSIVAAAAITDSSVTADDSESDSDGDDADDEAIDDSTEVEEGEYADPALV